MKLKRVAALLRDARALVEKSWYTDTYGKQHSDGSNGYCMVGAIMAAGRNINPEIRLHALGCLEHTLMGGVAAFNDHPGTTHDMVLSVFDEAIEFAENYRP